MNKTIWKFELTVTDIQTIKMPVGAEILTVQVQSGIPCLWALVNPDAEQKERIIETFGTGHPISYNSGEHRKYISTYQIKGGALVFHVFEYIGI